MSAVPDPGSSASYAVELGANARGWRRAGRARRLLFSLGMTTTRGLWSACLTTAMLGAGAIGCGAPGTAAPTELVNATGKQDGAKPSASITLTDAEEQIFAFECEERFAPLDRCNITLSLVAVDQVELGSQGYALERSADGDQIPLIGVTLVGPNGGDDAFLRAEWDDAAKRVTSVGRHADDDLHYTGVNGAYRAHLWTNLARVTFRMTAAWE